MNTCHTNTGLPILQSATDIVYPEKHIDKDTLIKSIKKTNKVIVIEEGWSQSGVGSEVISVIVENAFDYLDAEPLRFSGEDIPLPYAENLEKLAMPSTEVIVKKCLEIC